MSKSTIDTPLTPILQEQVINRPKFQILSSGQRFLQYGVAFSFLENLNLRRLKMTSSPVNILFN